VTFPVCLIKAVIGEVSVKTPLTKSFTAFAFPFPLAIAITSLACKTLLTP
jgi:hypothetical protein